jgi:hypothetical protein
MFFHRTLFALACATSLFVATNSSLAAQYKFLTVQANVNGPDTSQFNSLNNNGYIDVTHVHSAGGAAAFDNVNTAITNNFSNLFTGTNNVDGHLAQTHYNSQLEVHFNLANYNIKPSTVFGMWNTSDEVSWPPTGPGGQAPPVYTLKLMINNNIVPPTTFDLIGKQDNQADVQAHTELMMDPNTAFSPPAADTPVERFGVKDAEDATWKNYSRKPRRATSPPSGASSPGWSPSWPTPRPPSRS